MNLWAVDDRGAGSWILDYARGGVQVLRERRPRTKHASVLVGGIRRR
jgi:hypothetical protein